MVYRILGNQMVSQIVESVIMMFQALLALCIFFYTAEKMLEVTVNENINLAKNLQEH